MDYPSLYFLYLQRDYSINYLKVVKFVRNIGKKFPRIKENSAIMKGAATTRTPNAGDAR